MQGFVARTFIKHGFWISLLLHLLLLFCLIVVIVFQPKDEEREGLYIPSYTYQEPVRPVIQQTEVKPEKPMVKNGLQKRTMANKPRRYEIPTETQSETISRSEDGVHIVGDKKLDKPLIKLLGQAIGRQLIYPRIALDFNLRGTAYVGFTLRPDGYLTNVKLIKSSNAGVLDDEAVRAISAISPVHGVDPYVKEPEFMVVGIIFG